MDRLAQAASVIPGVTPGLANLPLTLPGISHAVKAVLGVAQQRSLPRFAAAEFSVRVAEPRAGRERKGRAGGSCSAVAGYVEQLLPSSVTAGGGAGAGRCGIFRRSTAPACLLRPAAVRFRVSAAGARVSGTRSCVHSRRRSTPACLSYSLSPVAPAFSAMSW